MSTVSIDWQQCMPKKNCLDGKIILITGAADGIGKAVSIAAAKYGATVILLDKKARHLEKVYDQIVEQNLPEPVMLPMDLLNCTPEAAEQICSGISKDFGRLDILLHNAAELGSPSPLDQYDYEYWQKVMQTNLQAPYFLTRTLLPVLQESKHGKIYFTSAKAGRQPSAYWGAYGIAYAGIEAQMQIWADELENPTNISVNSIDPGPVRTSFRRRSHPGESQNSLITPLDIAPAYIKLFSNELDYHGQQLVLQSK